MTHAPEQPTVVVGVEAITGSRAAIQAAAQEARYRGASLIAVMAYGSNPALGAPAGRPVGTMLTAQDERIAAEAALRDAVTDALGEQAGQVTTRTVTGPAGRKLVEVARAAGAQLIVLAVHGGTSVLPGSLSQHVLRRAPCPVLVVPETVQAEAAGGTAAAPAGERR